MLTSDAEMLVIRGEKSCMEGTGDNVTRGRLLLRLISCRESLRSKAPDVAEANIQLAR